MQERAIHISSITRQKMGKKSRGCYNQIRSSFKTPK